MTNQTLKVSIQYLGVLFMIVLLASGCARTRGSAGAIEASDAEETKATPGGSEIRGQEIARASEQSVEEILQGRVSGVTVMQAPGGGFQLRIRGTTSLNGSNEPLIVIDDVPLSAGYRGSIPVNPHDVDSIRVLKNAAETAFYGVRGANGVILITTKRGSKR